MVNDYNFNTNQNQNTYQDPYSQFNNMQNNSYQQEPEPVRKRRNGFASFLCVILGFVMLGLGVLISLNSGIFEENVISSIVKESKLMDSLKEEVKKEMNIQFTDTVSGEIDKTFDKVIGYVEDAFETGEVPEKEVIKEDMNEAFDSIIDAYTKDILDELQAKGEISIDELKNLEAGKAIAEALGDEEFDKIKEELKVEYGNTIKVDDENRKDIEKLMEENKDNAVVKETLDEAADELYKELTEVTTSLKFDDNSDENIFEVMKEITSITSTALTIAIVVAVVLIVIIALVDRNIFVTLKGMFGPLFVPGLLIALLGFVCSKLFDSAVMSSLETDLKEEAVKNIVVTIGDVAITPFIITGCVMLGCAIVFRIVGGIFTKKEVA